MKPIKARDLEKALVKKGFQRQEGSRHTQYYFYYQNKRTSVRVSISRGSNSVYSDSLIAYVRKEMKLPDKRQFELFIECALTEEKYSEYLINNGEITP
jgi:predicted RNA binding protein YcfA (HicA-like mRNA interferase family)